MNQADERHTAAGAVPSTGKIFEASPSYPEEKVFHFNRDIGLALFGAAEIEDRADSLIENIGALQTAADIADFKAVLRSIEYQVIDIRRIAASVSRIGTVQ